MDIAISATGSTEPAALSRFMDRLVGALKNALKRVFGVVITEVYSNPVASDLTLASHTLGSTPIAMVALPFDDARVWATEEDRALWGPTTITFRCSVASAKVQLILISPGA